MKILVCGGRDFDDYSLVEQVLDEYVIEFIVHGAASGADRLADKYALGNSIETHRYPAKWGEHLNAAGPIRNQEMLKNHNDLDLVIAFPGGKGTDDMVRRAKANGYKVRKVK